MYSMNLADRAALDALRSTVAADVSDSVWGEVEKQSDEFGVLGLKGAARQLVHGLVLKHGSHNQQSHGRGRGGSGGTGGDSAGNGGGSAGGKGGGNAAPAKAIDLVAASSEGKKLIAQGKANGLQMLQADMRPVKIKDSSFPEGSKGRLLASGVDMPNGGKGSYVGFAKPVKIKNGDSETTSTVHLIADGGYS